jgi:very-short-patch-repair endonuclease
MAAALRIADRQQGMITAAQARDAGLTRGQIEQLVRTGAWIRPFVGTYLVSGADPLLARLRAALHRRPDAIVCGLSAARLYGLGALPSYTPAEPVHLLVASTSARPRTAGLVLRAGRVPDDEVRIVRGLPATDVPRTLADLLLAWDRPEAVALMDAALHGRRLAHLDDVRAELFGRRGGAGRYRWLQQVDGRAESPLESRVRLVLTDAGLPPEELQYPIRNDAGALVARVDMAWVSRRVYVEADGVSFHGTPLLDPMPLHYDRDRQNRLLGLRWRPVRVTWRDVLTRPEYIVDAVDTLLRGPGRRRTGQGHHQAHPAARE